MQIKNRKSTIKVGLIGTGARGIHCFAPLLTAARGIEITALADFNEERLQIARDILGGTPALYTDINAMFREAKLDGVVITTPDYTHAQITCDALRAGIANIFVEKPMAISVQGCEEIIAVMNEMGGKVAIGFNLRFVPVLRRIKEIIDNGDIGQLMMIEIREFTGAGRTYMSRWNRKRELSGGLWIHKGSHDFDTLNWWNDGGTPRRVFAAAGLNAFRPNKIPFELKKNVPVGPTCSQCAYYEICPDRHEQGKTDLFNLSTAKEDGYYRDLCVYTSDKDVHDNGVAIVDYDNNVRASYAECFVGNFADRSYVVIGDKGAMEASLSNPTEVLFRPRWGKSRIIDVPRPRAGGHGGADPLLAENLVAMMQGQENQLSAIKDGISSVAVGEAAEISWREERAVNINDLVDLHSL